MNQKTYSKLNYPIDINILHFAGKLLQENGNFNWVPGWLIAALGVDMCAVGVNMAKQCVVHVNRNDNNSKSNIVEIGADTLWCAKQETLTNNNLPCHVIDCPVRQRVIKRSGQPHLEVTCFPMVGKRGFLMACGEGQLLNSYPITEILKAIAHVIECSLNNSQNSGKAASYFLPSEDMAQMWSEMLAGLSHDLRTPLACIKGYVTTLMREDVNWNADAQKEFLNIIVEETDHIETLINNLLDSSTLSWKGEIELNKEPVLLPKIVGKVLKDPSYRTKNHQFTVLFSDCFPFVEVDPFRIEQVLRNLVDNAVKYSMNDTEIIIKGEINSDEVVISVTDQGIGIDEEHLKRLFEKFFRVNSGIREHQKGMGLGLPLARQVLISHGGRIWAKSKLEQGTSLYFSLPTNPEGN
ncbi:MAG: hypothetical protein FH756_12315 [Firmicutes bacterium]|nr:hypothetical protein [Bacillota bacterium]